MERKAYQRSQAWEKFEILETVASCPLSIRKACSELGGNPLEHSLWSSPIHWANRALTQDNVEGGT
jgi:hypothetical protein